MTIEQDNNTQEFEDITEIEISLLLDAVKQRYKYDLSKYEPNIIKKNIQRFMEGRAIEKICDLIFILLRDEKVFLDFKLIFSVTVTSFFRDPNFYLSFIEKIIPVLKTYPFIKIWHAGCATGEEVYSVAILLYEYNLLSRAHIYATDINTEALEVGKEGVYDLYRVQQSRNDYNKCNLAGNLDDYFTTGSDKFKVKPFLRKNIDFYEHNLISDSVFSEVNIVLCRNVLIYFSRELKSRVVSLFAESLCLNGFLCLGGAESLSLCGDAQNKFLEIDKQQKIYKKCGVAKYS